MLNRQRHPSRHVPDDVLVQYLDGELETWQMSDVQAHLVICWSCQGRACEFKQNIRLFLQYRQAMIQQLGGPPYQFGGFRTRLRQQAAEMEILAARTHAGRWSTWLAWAGVSLRYVTIPRAVTAAIMSVVLAWWFFFSGVPVSAQAVLRRAVLSESARLRPFSRPVIHQCLRVSTEGRAATWEIWQAPMDRKIHQLWTGGGGLPRELNEVLAANHFDPQQPLSAVGFAAWRDSIAKKHDDVWTNERTHAVVISTEFAGARQGQIRHATFTVQASDWHPVSQVFEVQTASGEALHYSLEETSYAVVPIEQVSAEVFGVAEPAAALAPAPRMDATEPVPEESVPAGISEEQLAESEVLLSEALHETDADTLEAPEIHRAVDHIDLSLWTDDQERKRRILASIEQIPAVVTHLKGMGEGAIPVAAGTAPPNAAPATYATDPPLAKALKEYAGSTQAATNYLAAAADASQRLFVETAALNRLAAEYPDERWRPLPAALRNRLDRIAADYIASIRRRANEYLVLLSPVLEAMASREGLATAEGEHPDGTGAWRSVARELNEAVPRLQTPFRRLFMEDHVDSPSKPLSAHELLAETIAARARLRTALDRLGDPSPTFANVNVREPCDSARMPVTQGLAARGGRLLG